MVQTGRNDSGWTIMHAEFFADLCNNTGIERGFKQADGSLTDDGWPAWAFLTSV